MSTKPQRSSDGPSKRRAGSKTGPQRQRLEALMGRTTGDDFVDAQMETASKPQAAAVTPLPATRGGDPGERGDPDSEGIVTPLPAAKSGAGKPQRVPGPAVRSVQVQLKIPAELGERLDAWHLHQVISGASTLQADVLEELIDQLKDREMPAAAKWIATSYERQGRRTGPGVRGFHAKVTESHCARLDEFAARMRAANRRPVRRTELVTWLLDRHLPKLHSGQKGNTTDR